MSEPPDLLRALLAELGEDALAAAPELAAWSAAAAALGRRGSIAALGRAWQWVERIPELQAAPRAGWPDQLRRAGLVEALGPDSLAQLLVDAGSPERALLGAAAREQRLDRLAALAD